MREARRTSRSPPGAPVSATTTRSRVSHDAVMPWSSMYCCRLSSTLSATHSSAKFAQRGEVAGAEVVRERGVDLLGLVDVAVGHAPAQRLGRAVDQLDLVGPAHDVVAQRLTLLHAGDALHDVVHRFEVLDVHRRHHVDPGLEQRLDVLPPLLVARARHVRVRELVDERDLRMPREHRVEIHLLELATPVRELAARDDLEIADLFGGQHPAVGFDEADHHVGPAIVAAPTLVQHRERLADAGSCTEIDTKRAAGHRSSSSDRGRG